MGRFIGVSHFLARLLGVDPREIFRAENKEQQAEIFDASMGRLLKKPMVRKALQSPLALYGLGIPAAQFQKLQGDAPTMAHVLHDRLRRLACDFDLSSNYFAWQAFGRCYDTAQSVAIPRYLQQRHYQHLRDRVDNVAIYRKIATSFLKEQSVASVDAYVLLDAQDWMDDQQLNALWAEINRTATPTARVIFRTAGEENIILNRLNTENLAGWAYRQEISQALHLEDRSAIYGGFHLMVRNV